MLQKTLLTLSLIIACPLAKGDTFVMKDGKKLTGTIVRETDTSYIARIAVTPTIFERKELAKAEVTKIIPDDKSIEAFEELGELKPMPDLSSEKNYQARIKELSAFLETFPESSNKSKVSDFLQSLEGELQKIEDGQLKIDGEWITEEERLRRKYEIDARLILQSLNEQYSKGLVLGVLREYHQNQSDFSQSALAPEIRQIVGKSLKRYENFLNKEIEASKERIEKREAALRSSAPDERRRLESIFASEQEEFNKRAQQDEANDQIWIVVSGYDAKGLQDALRLIKQEESKLQRVPRSEPMTAEELLASFWGAIDSSNVDEAGELLSQIKRINLNGSYLNPLTAALESLKAEIMKAEQMEAERIKAEKMKAEKMKEEARKAAEKEAMESKEKSDESPADGEEPEMKKEEVPK